MTNLTVVQTSLDPEQAAAVGLAMPTLLFILIARGSGNEHTWGAVISTDTAFVLGPLALVRPPASPEPYGRRARAGPRAHLPPVAQHRVRPRGREQPARGDLGTIALGHAADRRLQATRRATERAVRAAPTRGRLERSAPAAHSASPILPAGRVRHRRLASLNGGAGVRGAAAGGVRGNPPRIEPRTRHQGDDPHEANAEPHGEGTRK
jgi:hypothetical protein